MSDLKDFQGATIVDGDLVLYRPAGRVSLPMRLGTVVRVGPKKVTVKKAGAVKRWETGCGSYWPNAVAVVTGIEEFE